MLAWLGVVAVQLWIVNRDEALALDPAELRSALKPGEGYLGAYQGGQKLGYMHWRVQRDGRKIALFQESVLRMRVAGVAQRIASDLQVVLDESSALERLTLDLFAGPLRLQVLGLRSPVGLRLQIDIGGERVEREIALAEPPIFEISVPVLLAGKPPEPGRRYRLNLFDARLLSNQPTEIEVIGPDAISAEGRLIPAVHFRRRVAGAEIDSWIDSSGRLLREVLPGGLRFEAEDRERALAVPDEAAEIRLSEQGKAILRSLAPTALSTEGGESP